MHKLTKDLTGKRFGRLTALHIVDRRSDGCVWECACDCGNKTKTAGANLRKGRAKSCGCLKREATSARSKVHGLFGTPEYSTLQNAKWRCHNPKNKNYKFYGGRGIRVCDRWRFGENGKSGIECFIEDVGERPFPKKSYTLDRIDVNGNYEPGNCRWVTQAQQCSNTRRNIMLQLGDVMVTQKEWCAHHGVNPRSLWRAMKRGLTPEQWVATKRKSPVKHS